MNPLPSNSKWDQTCSICGDKPAGTWRMVGYDELGEIWICPPCWELHKKDPYFQNVKIVTQEQKSDNDSQ